MGKLSGQWTKEGQSDRDLRQSPFPHLIGKNLGHSTYAGHSSLFETQELSGHFALI